MTSLVRLDHVWSSVPNIHDIPIELMATSEVPVEIAAVRQAAAVTRLHERLAREGGQVRRMTLTPDLHPGAGIPVGSVVETVGGVAPGLIGGDIGCGMRLLAFDLPADRLEGRWEQISRRLRHLFFQGGRDVRLDASGRYALLRDGLYGLADHLADPRRRVGLWSLYDLDQQERDLDVACDQGSLPTSRLFDGFAGWVHGPAGHDAHLGSVGGGNHFVEIGQIAEIREGSTAWLWGLREGQLTALIHTGSLGFGAAVAAAYADKRDPMLALTGQSADGYLDAMRNAANFAFANRLVLGLMAARAIQDTIGQPARPRLIGDAPHNLIWPNGENQWRHRKGATPAQGPAAHPLLAAGHPVLIPGSMGDSSWVLRGNGQERALSSASHGAGRQLSRGAAAAADNGDMRSLRVVSPVDPRGLIAAGRRDLLDQAQARLREEAPGAYKAVGPVIDSVAQAGAADKVARLAPLLTVKG